MMLDKAADRINEEERQERRLERRFSVFFTVLVKRMFCVLAAALACMAARGSWAVLDRETSSPAEKNFADQYAEYQKRAGITLPEFDGRPDRLPDEKF